MKSSAKNIENELFEGQNPFIETNPFQKGGFAPSQKPGKRPRIIKPVYSVRLS